MNALIFVCKYTSTKLMGSSGAVQQWRIDIETKVRRKIEIAKQHLTPRIYLTSNDTSFRRILCDIRGNNAAKNLKQPKL